METKPAVLFDGDFGLHLGFALDVDDDLALAYLLASPEVEVVAVTATHARSCLATLTHAWRPPRC